MVRVSHGLAAATLVVLLAGCTDDPAAPPGVPTEQTVPVVAEPTAESPTASPTPTPAGPANLSDPALGLSFTGLPPDAEGAEVLALEAYQQYEVEYWRALRTNELSPALDTVASPDVRDFVRTQVDNNRPEGWLAEGAYAVEIRDVQTADDEVVVEACRDGSGITFRSPEGTASAADAGLDEPFLTRMTMLGNGDVWRVETRENIGPC